MKSILFILTTLFLFSAFSEDRKSFPAFINDYNCEVTNFYYWPKGTCYSNFKEVFDEWNNIFGEVKYEILEIQFMKIKDYSGKFERRLMLDETCDPKIWIYWENGNVSAIHRMDNVLKLKEDTRIVNIIFRPKAQ